MPAAKKEAAPRRKYYKKAAGSSANDKKQDKEIAALKKQVSALKVKDVRGAARNVDELSAKKYLDPKGKGTQPPADAQSVGNFLAIPSIERLTLTPTASTAYWAIVLKTRSAINFVYINISTRQAIALTAPQLSASSAESIRPLRLSCYVRNTTVFTSMAGVVRVLNTPAPLVWEFDGTGTMKISTAFNNALSAMVDSDPDTKSYSANELADEHFWVSAMSSNVHYHEWNERLPHSTDAEKEALLEDSSHYGAMNTMIFHLPSPTASNSYDFNVYDQSAARFPANILYQNLAGPQPRTTIERQMAINDAAQRNAGAARSQAPTTSAAAASAPSQVGMRR
jgi:hypothetical protein